MSIQTTIKTTHQETEISPLVEEVSVYVDAVGFGKIVGDELADCGQVC